MKVVPSATLVIWRSEPVLPTETVLARLVSLSAPKAKLPAALARLPAPKAMLPVKPASTMALLPKATPELLRDKDKSPMETVLFTLPAVPGKKPGTELPLRNCNMAPVVPAFKTPTTSVPAILPMATLSAPFTPAPLLLPM